MRNEQHSYIHSDNQARQHTATSTSNHTHHHHHSRFFKWIPIPHSLHLHHHAQHHTQVDYQIQSQCKTHFLKNENRNLDVIQEFISPEEEERIIHMIGKNKHHKHIKRFGKNEGKRENDHTILVHDQLHNGHPVYVAIGHGENHVDPTNIQIIKKSSSIVKQGVSFQIINGKIHYLNRVAVKIINAYSEQDLQKIIRELEISKLSKPETEDIKFSSCDFYHIRPLQIDDEIYHQAISVMPLIPGKDLLDLIKERWENHTTLSDPNEILDIAKKIVIAAEILADMNIIYNDWKADNIKYDLITKAITVFDYGESFDTSKELPRSEFLPTAQYVAPEVYAQKIVPLKTHKENALIAIGQNTKENNLLRGSDLTKLYGDRFSNAYKADCLINFTIESDIYALGITLGILCNLIKNFPNGAQIQPYVLYTQEELYDQKNHFLPLPIRKKLLTLLQQMTNQNPEKRPPFQFIQNELHNIQIQLNDNHFTTKAQDGFMFNVKKRTASFTNSRLGSKLNLFNPMPQATVHCEETPLRKYNAG